LSVWPRSAAPAGMDSGSVLTGGLRRGGEAVLNGSCGHQFHLPRLPCWYVNLVISGHPSSSR
jgi:hypothetical protein